jgi:membrane protein DedA with SNARE-associated domain
MHWLESFLASYGPVVVLIGTFFEGEIIVTVAGFAAHQGIMNPYVVGLCAFLGSFIADQGIFLMTRRYVDHPWVERLRQRPLFATAMGMLGRRPDAFILAFRFLYGLRTVGPAAIALSGVSSFRFLILNAVSAAVWAATFTLLGYFFGQTVEMALGRLGRFEHRLMVALAIAFAVLLIVHAAKKFFLRNRKIGE